MTSDGQGLDGASSRPTATYKEGRPDDITHKKLRRNRSVRRHNAKSEPAGRTGESTEGVRESDMTATSSGEAQPLLQVPKNVR